MSRTIQMTHLLLCEPSWIAIWVIKFFFRQNRFSFTTVTTVTLRTNCRHGGRWGFLGGTYVKTFLSIFVPEVSKNRSKIVFLRNLVHLKNLRGGGVATSRLFATNIGSQNPRESTSLPCKIPCRKTAIAIGNVRMDALFYGQSSPLPLCWLLRRYLHIFSATTNFLTGI